MICKARDIMEELHQLNPDVLEADGFRPAIIGYTMSHSMKPVLVYDADHCCEILMEDGMSDDEAWEYLEYNTFGAYMGPDTPIFVRLK